MTEAEIEAATVARGTWLYDGRVDMPVRIVGLTFDYWFAVAAADQLEEREEPRPLGNDGLLYYIRFVQFAGPAYCSLEAAKAAAQALVPSPISWR